MLRPYKLLFLPLAALLFLPVPSRAALIQTYDLTTLCFLSTDAVEARLTRHHLPGQPEWTDRFTATVLKPLTGCFHAGDQIKGLDLSLYDPAGTGQHCILFLAPNTVFLPTPPKDAPLRTVDMLLVDSHNRVRRYFQQSDPGGLAADSGPGRKYPTLAEERTLIVSRWTAVKKLKAPPYQVLHR